MGSRRLEKGVETRDKIGNANTAQNLHPATTLFPLSAVVLHLICRLPPRVHAACARNAARGGALAPLSFASFWHPTSIFFKVLCDYPAVRWWSALRPRVS